MKILHTPTEIAGPIIAKLWTKRKEPLLKNSFFITIGTASGALLGFVFWMIAARFYSTTNVGLASALIAAFGLITTFSTLGFHIGIIRYLPLIRDKRKLINSCFTVVGLSSLLISGIFIAGLPLWSPDLMFVRQNTIMLLSFFMFTIANSLLMLQSNVFIGLRRSEFLSIIQMGRGALKIPPAIVLVSLGAFGIFLSWGISICIMFLVGVLFLMKIQPGYRPVPAISRKIVNEMAHFSFVNYISEAIGNAPIYILPLMILGILGAEQTAYYYIACSIVGVFSIIPGSITQSLFAEGSNDPEMLRANTVKAIKIIVYSLVPTSLLLFYFGDKILLLFGDEYSKNALKLLWILFLATIPQLITAVFLIVCMVNFNLKYIAYINLSRAILIPVMTYLLMIRMGIIGVGLGYLLAVGIIAIIVTVISRKYLKRKSTLNLKGIT